MSSSPNDSQQNRRTTTPTSSSWIGSVVSFGTKALALYGAYHLVSLAIDAWNEGSDITTKEDEEQQQQQQEIHHRRYFSTLHNSHATTASDSPLFSKSSAAMWWELIRGITSDANERISENGGRPRIESSHVRRRRRHCELLLLRNSRDHVRDAMHRLVPGLLKRTIYECTDFQKERRALQEIRAQQQDEHDDDAKKRRCQESNRLWKTIQYQSTTRLIVSIYAPSILFVVLTVQVAVILADQQKKLANQSVASGVTSLDPSMDTFGNPFIHLSGNHHHNKEGIVVSAMGDYRWILEQTYQYMFKHGLPSLLETVQRILRQFVVESEEDEWNVVDPASSQFTPEQLRNLLQRVHVLLRKDAALQRERSLLRFVQPPAGILMMDASSFTYGSDHKNDTNYATENSNRDDNYDEKEQYHRRMDLLDVTWDILESPMVEDALEGSLQVFQKSLVQAAFPTLDDDSSRHGLPLAQLLAGMKQACDSMFAAFGGNSSNGNDDNEVVVYNHENAYLRALEHMPPIIETLNVCFSSSFSSVG